MNYDTLYKAVDRRAATARGGWLPKVAKVMGISVQALIYGDNLPPEQKARRVPLLAMNKLGTLEDTLLALEREQEASVVVPVNEGSSNLFAVTIQDAACAPILDVGDVVLVDPDIPALPGDIVVAHIDKLHGGVCRKYQSISPIDSSQFVLNPLNSDYPPINVPSDSAGEIIGVVISSTRNMLRRRA